MRHATKSAALHALVLVAGLLLGSAPAEAGVARRINYQGKLLDSSNNPRNGTVLLNFRIYTAASGGSAAWSESHPSISVSNGVFSVQLGSAAPLSESLFSNASAYLEIDVDPSGAEPLETLSPRQQLLMSAFSFSALRLASDGDIAVIAATAQSTFTSAGHLLLPGRLSAADASVSGGLTASSGTFTASGTSQFSVQTSSGILVQAGNLRIGSSSARYIADDSANYRTYFSSHVAVAGKVRASNFSLELLGETELSGANSVLTLSNLPARKHLHIIIDITGMASAGIPQLQFNGDSGTNYQYRMAEDNGNATTATAGNQLNLLETAYATAQMLQLDGSNYATAEKVFRAQGTVFRAAGTAPTILEGGGVWRNTSSQVTSISLTNSAAANFLAGTRITVLGAGE